LQQAQREDVPLYERIKFLGIYSNNMDEFYRVRVATLKRLTKLKGKAKDIIGYEPVEVLKEINKIVLRQNVEYEATQMSIRREMQKYNIFVIDETQMNENQMRYARSFFCRELKNSLMPIVLKDKKMVPDLVDDNIYFALDIRLRGKKKSMLSILQLPTEKFDRFFIFPKIDERTYIVYLDDVVRIGLKELFKFMPIDSIAAYAFKITKDAELDIEDDISASYLEIIDQSLRRRKKGNAVRLSYDRNMPEELLLRIKKLFKIGNMDTILPGGRYHNSKDLLKFPNLIGKGVRYENFSPVVVGALELQKSFFDTLKREDIFLHYPYHSFNYFIDFLREASIDSDVFSIKVTLYRLAKKSDVISALINGANNGKNVTAVIELQARFDESENIYWSKILSEAGVKVIYGVQGLKVHSKLVLVSRKEEEKIVEYALVGTGNFNESTAKLYTDIAIMTSNKKITTEVHKVFDFLKHNYKHFRYNHLLVSPFNFRTMLKKLIRNEIENAKKGKIAYIYLKLNNIDDREMVRCLYEASQRGVEVVLFVRGMFSVVTGVEGVSEKIEARGIIDRFLEHSRFMIFANGGKAKYYISSADLMVRNIDRRVEVTMPVYDSKIQKILSDLFEIYRRDNVSSRILDRELSNKMYEGGKEKHNAQIEIFNYLKKIEQ
jgi:polyphosphate kinase